MEETQNATVSARFANSNELLKVAFNRYRNHAKRYWFILLPPTLIEVIYNSLQSIFFTKDTFSPVLIVPLLIAVILLVVTSSLGQLALLYAVSNDLLTFEQAYNKAWKNLLSYWWVVFLAGVIVVFGYILLIIPGIIWSIFYSLVAYVFVNENLHGRLALNKSKEYVKGYWWALLTRYIFIIVIEALLSVPATGVLYAIDFIGQHGVAQLLNPFISLLTIPLDVLFTFAIYEQLKSFVSLPAKSVKKRDSIGAVIVSVIGIILVMIPPLLLTLYIAFFRPFQMSGDSMTPTYTNNEYFITDVAAANSGDLNRGDVVVFHAPPAPTKDFVKRIIGLPGDTVMLKDGNVYLNRTELNERAYLGSNIKTYGGAFLQDGQTVSVPQGKYFVLGDNREYSSDSREWGFVDQKAMIGVVIFCYWNCPANK